MTDKLKRMVPALAWACALASGPPAGAATPMVGAPAPEVVVRTLDGHDLDLAQVRGKVVVVNVWATWCAPCRAEMPMLNTFFLQHRDAGVLLVGLSADRSRDKGVVRKVMSAFAYPAALLSEARVDTLDDPLALPITYVVDKTGLVRAVFVGTGASFNEQLLADAVRPFLQP